MRVRWHQSSEYLLGCACDAHAGVQDCIHSDGWGSVGRLRLRSSSCGRRPKARHAQTPTHTAPAELWNHGALSRDGERGARIDVISSQLPGDRSGIVQSSGHSHLQHDLGERYLQFNAGCECNAHSDHSREYDRECFRSVRSGSRQLLRHNSSRDGRSTCSSDNLIRFDGHVEPGFHNHRADCIS